MNKKVDCDFPAPQDFIRNEIKTLKYISEHKEFLEGTDVLYRDAETYIKTSSPKFAKSLNFKSHLNATKDSKIFELHFGVTITTKNNKFELLSYSLAVCINKRIIRRFHFDYAYDGMGTKECSPIFHLQAGGETNNFLDDGYTVAIEEDGLDLPKILNTPMTLALLLNMILISFRSKEFSKIVSTNEWKNLLMSDEEVVFTPYFKTCSDLIRSAASNKKSFFKECFYQTMSA